MAQTPPLAIVDASVAIKWFKDEEQTDLALRMLADYRERRIDLASVELLFFEILNALRFDPLQTGEALQRVVYSLSESSVELYPFLRVAARTVENTRRYGISVYDSSYLSLGEELGAPVYTADRKLIRRVGGETLKHISEY